MAQGQTRTRRLSYFNLTNDKILLADKFSNRIPGFEHVTQERLFSLSVPPNVSFKQDAIKWKVCVGSLNDMLKCGWEVNQIYIFKDSCCYIFYFIYLLIKGASFLFFIYYLNGKHVSFWLKKCQFSFLHYACTYFLELNLRNFLARKIYFRIYRLLLEVLEVSVSIK